ncbi:MAG: VanZ family protein [Polyangiales bacterium]
MSLAAQPLGPAPAPPLSAASERPSLFVLDPGLPRFAGVLLGYVVALAALATLSPFDFDFRHPHGFLWQTSVSDVALNLAFLFPVGFLWRLSRAERVSRYALDSLLLGVLLSIGLELLQRFLPSRVSSPTDMATNGLGCWAGGLLHARVGPFLDRRLQKQLSLHLPLANLLYLSVPLVSLDALAVRYDYELVADLPLGVFMAFIAAGLYRHRLAGSGRPFAHAYASAIGLSFGVGYLPICSHYAQLWPVSVLGMAALTRLFIAVGTGLPATERRFVLVTIRRAQPCLLLYLALLALRSQLPVWLGLVDARELTSLSGEQASAIALLRDVAAFTLVGYVASEREARSSAPVARVLLGIAQLVVLAAGAFAWLERGRLPLAHVAVQIALLSLAGLAGAAIHRAQLRLVRSWDSRRPSQAIVAPETPIGA